jgi:hypothetical protein
VKFEILMKFIYGLRLVGGHTHHPPRKPDDIKDARRYFTEYFACATLLFGKHFAKYTNHSMLHLVDDVQNYESCFGGISAYKYENMQGLMFRGVRIYLPRGFLYIFN